MTKGPWTYERANGHHHVLMGEESLDVNREDDARAIAEVPAFLELLSHLEDIDIKEAFNLAQKISDRLKKKTGKK